MRRCKHMKYECACLVRLSLRKSHIRNALGNLFHSSWACVGSAETTILCRDGMQRTASIYLTVMSLVLYASSPQIRMFARDEVVFSTLRAAVSAVAEGSRRSRTLSSQGGKYKQVCS